MSEAPESTGHAPAASEQASDAPNTAASTETSAAPAPKKELSFREIFDSTKAELEGEASGDQTTTQATGDDTTTNQSSTTEQQTQEAIKPHDRWTAEEKAIFASQPPEVQKAMLNQYSNWEKGFNKKFGEVAAVRKLKEEIDPLFTPDVRARMQANGITEGQVIAKLAEFAQNIEADPVAAIQHLMARHRIDPKVFISEQGQGLDTSQTQNGKDQAANSQPDTTQLVQQLVQQQVASLVQPIFEKMTELEYGHNAWRQQQAAEQDKTIEAAITGMVEAKDESGTPSYPHMERVADRMAQLIEHDPRYADMDPRQRLEEAYMVAVYSDSQLRDEIAAAEASKRLSAMEQQRANERLKQSASVKPTPTSSTNSQAPQSFRDMFNETLRELGQT